MAQTHVFTIGIPIQSDLKTPPNVKTSELKAAMALVHNHVLGLEPAHSIEDLAAALAKLAIAANNENWCIYVP